MSESNHFEELQKLRQERRQEIESLFAQGLLFQNVRRIRKESNMLEPLWGDYIYRQALTVIIGDPGIGKTTLIYSLMANTSTYGEFLEIPATKELMYLPLDFESASPLIKKRVESYKKLELVNALDELYIYNSEFTFDEILPEIRKFNTGNYKFDVLIIDNLMTAFNMQDENDNSEAIKRIRQLRKLAKELDCAIIMLHHPSKANADGMRKGSGAFAWARSADIYLNFNSMGSIIEIEQAKNRCAENKDSIYCCKNGNGEFTRCEKPENIIIERTEDNDKESVRATPRNEVKSIVLKYVGSHTRSEIIEFIKKNTEKEYSTALMDKALRELVRENKLEWKYGIYKIGNL